MVTVLKVGGELLESETALRPVAAAAAGLARRGPLVVVHGGGRAIDAELLARGHAPRFADGLRITDASALDVVVCVLAGRTNTTFVAALANEGLRAVGLTGADAGIGRGSAASLLTTRTGEHVDLGLVGDPDRVDVTLLRDLVRLGYVPVVASIGTGPDGSLLNVNADTLASRLAAALQAERLLIAGTTPGVLDGTGRTIGRLSIEQIAGMTASGVAHSGMIAKLAACGYAAAAGVPDVAIVDGRDGGDYIRAAATRIVHPAATAPRSMEQPR